MHLICVSLFYRPSRNLLDNRPYYMKKFFILSERVLSDNEAMTKVSGQVKESAHYRYEVESVSLPNITVAQATELLKAIGQRIV